MEEDTLHALIRLKIAEQELAVALEEISQSRRLLEEIIHNGDLPTKKESSDNVGL